MLMMMLCVVPVWNACLLLEDENYVFWAGRLTPMWIIVFCFSIFPLYIGTLWIFFGQSVAKAQTEQTIMMIATIFITLLGLGLMLVSLPLSRQATETYTNLMHRCDYSLETHRIYEVSQVLQSIRQTPGCSDKYSVEECPGFQEVQPYTGYLKNMENSFRCSGFCFSATSSTGNMDTYDNSRSSVWGDAASPTPAPEAATGAATGGAREQVVRIGAGGGVEGVVPGRAYRAARHHEDHVLAFGMLELDSVTQQGQSANHTQASFSGAPVDVELEQAANYPPTLFSDANYQASCEGMAARSMINFAGDVGFQTFYQGIYLVLISISMGSLKLIGFCSHKSPAHAQKDWYNS